MKAAILPGLRQPFRFVDIPTPEIGPEEVLIKTRTCGICRTDLHIQDGMAYIPTFPHVPGHEPAGTIAAIGGRVEHLRVGQRVTLHLFVTCGACRCCHTGQDAQCTRVSGIIGVTLPGGFAEFFKAPARNVLPLPDSVSFESGGLVSCGVITAVHAYRRSRLLAHDVAIVIGAGGIGLMLIQLLKSAGLRVVALSRSQKSLDLARREGASLAFPLHSPESVERIRAYADGEGADCVFDCVGTAATMETAATLARRGGRIVVIGEEPEFPRIDTIQIAQRELEIIGSRNGSIQDAADAIGMIEAGIIRPPIAGRFPLEGLNDALQRMRDGGAQGRLLIEMPI